MDRIFISFILIGMCGIAHSATTTCVHNDTKMVVIKKDVLPVSASANASDMTFELQFDYDMMPGNSSSRTVTGTATCNEIYTDTSGGALVQGSANTYLRALGDDYGIYCWCRLTGPIVTSWWVYNREYSDDDACAANCAADCANAIKNNTNGFLTNGIYRAIW